MYANKTTCSNYHMSSLGGVDSFVFNTKTHFEFKNYYINYDYSLYSLVSNIIEAYGNIRVYYISV